MNDQETAQVLKAFAASFAGTSYDDLKQYEHEGLLKDVTGESGRSYQVFLATDMVEVISSDPPASTWVCRATVSVTPARKIGPSGQSLSGCKDIMPGQASSGDLEHIGIVKPSSTASCYGTIAIFVFALFALVYWAQSCRLSE